MLDNPPSLSGSIIWLTGADSGDFDLVLSSGTQSKLRGVLEACGGNLDDQCYQDARKVLQESELQLDAGVDRRHLGHMLSKTFRKPIGKVGKITNQPFFTVVSISLMAQWHIKHFDDDFKPLRLPHGSIEKIAALDAGTSVVVSAEGQPVVTITPTPDPTSLKGSQTPHVTSVSTAHGAFASGDLAACLDASLASRIGEIMRRGATCSDGSDFDAGKIKRRRAARSSYGAAICGVQDAVPNVQAGSALQDLLLLDTGNLHFEFANGAGDIARAANQAVGFVLDYAPMLALDEAAAADLGTYLFALAVDTLVENIPLGAENRIQSSLVTTVTQTTKPTATKTTTTATSTSSGCPDPEKTPDKPDEPKGPSANCDMDNLSDIPGNVFGGSKNNVYHHFCERWVADYDPKMRVDAAGNNKDPEIIKSKKIQGRTPPPNPKVYKDHDFNLGFKPSGGEGKKQCAQNCTVAFDTLYSTCSNTGAKDQRMQKKGSIDVGCGVFDYEIAAPAPKTPREVHNPRCYRPDEFGDHDDIHESEISWMTGFACAGTALKTIKRGDTSTNLAKAYYDNHQPVQYNVYWKDGCELEDGADEVYPDNPLGRKDPSHTECQKLLLDNYKRCLNGGVGGSIQAGCLVYEFKATHDKK
ncbi:hypothetical protein PG991_008470 [Apiospora marii]|uniref:Uncharacterized protein n=1 Tax=Apiospora marii TaxID=335849 RepID=A0ABR1RL30_9PEZI